MIPLPEFNAAGELPPGEHEAVLGEVEKKFGTINAQRRRLMAGLKRAVDNLAKSNVRKIWIDDSFVTDKKTPRDIDGVWETHDGIDLAVLDPSHKRRKPLRLHHLLHVPSETRNPDATVQNPIHKPHPP